MRNLTSSLRRVLGPAAMLAAIAAAGADAAWAATWSAVNAGLPGAGLGVTGLSVDPRSPSTIYAQTFASGGILGGFPGLFKTTDGGQSWTAVSSILSATIVAIDPKNSSTLFAGSDQGVLKSVNGGATWSDASSGLPKGMITRLAIDPLVTSTLYAVVYTVSIGVPITSPPLSLLFKSTNGGSSWSALDLGIPMGPSISVAGAVVNALVIDPANPSNLYVLVPPFFPPGNGPPSGPPKGYVLKSTDGGESWNELDLGLAPGPPIAFPNSLVIDSASNLYAVMPQFGGPAPSGGILISTDGGSTWKTLPPLPVNAFGNVIVDPTDSATLYVSGSMFTPGPATGPPGPPAPPKSVVLKSTDGGQHWNVYDLGLPAYTTLSSLALDPVTPSTVYAGFSGFPALPVSAGGSSIPSGGVVRSTDGGMTWSDASAGLVSLDIRALATNPTSSNTVFAGGSSGVFRSDDAGASWSATALTDFTGTLTADSLNIYAQTGRPNGCNSDDGILLRSADGGASWSNNVSPLNSGCILSATFFAAHAAPMAINPADPKTLYLAESDDSDGYSAILKSTDGGANWSAAWDWFTGLRAAVRTLAIDSVRPATIYAGLNDASPGAPASGGLFKSTDGGITWTNTGVSSAAISLLAIDPANSSIVYAAGEIHNGDPKGFQGLFKSTNGGSTWQAIGKGLDSIIGTRLTSVTALMIAPANSSVLYLGTTNAGIFRSADGGATWSAFNDGLGNLQIRALTTPRGTARAVYVGTPGGVFKILDP